MKKTMLADSECHEVGALLGSMLKNRTFSDLRKMTFTQR